MAWQHYQTKSSLFSRRPLVSCYHKKMFFNKAARNLIGGPRYVELFHEGTKIGFKPVESRANNGLVYANGLVNINGMLSHFEIDPSRLDKRHFSFIDADENGVYSIDYSLPWVPDGLQPISQGRDRDHDRPERLIPAAVTDPDLFAPFAKGKGGDR